MRIEEAEIRLNDIKVHAYHGVYPKERQTGTDYLVNVRCKLKEFDDMFESDELAYTVDYSAIYDLIIKHMSKPANLIETVAKNISDDILATFPRIASTKIEIEKTNPPLSGECKSASIVMHCVRTLALFVCMMMSIPTLAADQFTLMIDAGHGGQDPGAIGSFSQEKDINLKVALAFGQLVEKTCPEVKVLYTRKTDVFVELNERANIANRSKANLFVSIHTNALPKGRIASGFETYTLGMHRASENLEVAKRENSVITYEKDYRQKYEDFNPNSAESYIMFELMQDQNMAQSVDFAKLVQSNTCNIAGRIDKGVHQAGFLVLRKTSMPSCLIELGFISTQEEENYLNTEEGVDALARGIFAGFIGYRNKYDKNIVVPYQIPESLTKPQYPTLVPQQEVKRERKQVEKKEETSIPVVAQKDLATLYSGRNGIYFRIQLFASKRMQRPGSQLFKGLENVDYYQEGELFKYTYGDTNNYSEIISQQKKVKEQFPESYIIAIRNGVKIPLTDALREYNVNKNK